MKQIYILINEKTSGVYYQFFEDHQEALDKASSINEQYPSEYDFHVHKLLNNKFEEENVVKIIKN